MKMYNKQTYVSVRERRSEKRESVKREEMREETCRERPANLSERRWEAGERGGEEIPAEERQSMAICCEPEGLASPILC